MKDDKDLIPIITTNLLGILVITFTAYLLFTIRTWSPYPVTLELPGSSSPMYCTMGPDKSAILAVGKNQELFLGTDNSIITNKYLKNTVKTSSGVKWIRVHNLKAATRLLKELYKADSQVQVQISADKELHYSVIRSIMYSIKYSRPSNQTEFERYSIIVNQD